MIFSNALVSGQITMTTQLRCGRSQYRQHSDQIFLSPGIEMRASFPGAEYNTYEYGIVSTRDT